MRFRHVAILLLAGLALIGGGQFRIAKILIHEPPGDRTIFRVCLPGRKPDAYAMTDQDFMCHLYDWYGLRKLGGFGYARSKQKEFPALVTLAAPLQTEAEARVAVSNFLLQEGISLNKFEEARADFDAARREWFFLYTLKPALAMPGGHFMISINETGRIHVTGGR